MAQLKDLIVNGASRFIGDIFGSTVTAKAFYGSLQNTMSTYTATTSGRGDLGSGASPRYLPYMWYAALDFDPADGDIIVVKMPSGGNAAGVWLSTNGDVADNYHPIAINGANRLTTHFAANTILMLVYQSNMTVSTYALAGANSATNITGIWRVINYYDSNTNTLLRTYASSTDIEVPLIGQSSANSTTADWSTYAGTYKDWYGAIPNDDAKRAKINLSTGAMTVPGGITANLTGNASTATTFATGRTFSISDNDATNTGPASSSFNGSDNLTIKLPATIKATLTGNASSATKVTQLASANTAAAYRILLSTSDADTEEQGSLHKDTDLRWNPSTNTLDIAASNANGILKAASGTLTFDAASTIYINNPNSCSVIFTNDGASASNEYARFNTNGNLILSSNISAVNDITDKLYVNGTAHFTTALAASNDLVTITNTQAIAADGYSAGLRYLIPNMPATSHATICLGKAKSTKNSTYMEYYHAGDGSDNNFWGVGFYGAGNGFLRVHANGRVQINKHLGYAALNNTYGLRIGPDDQTHLDLGYDGLQGLNANSSAASAIYFQYAGGDIQHGKSDADSHLTSFGNITPGTDDTYDLGSSSYRWKALYGNQIISQAVGSSDNVYIAYPEGGTYGSSSVQIVTGALCITLPQGYNSKTMLQFKIHIFNFKEPAENIIYTVSGYTDTNWAQAQAYSEGTAPTASNSHSDLKVIFTDNGSKKQVIIGETNTTWSYPKIAITDIVFGHSNHNTYDQWATGWNISFIRTMPTAAATTVTINAGTSYRGGIWGTARNITIQDADATNSGAATSVNGSAAVALKLPSTIKATLSGNASTATKVNKDLVLKVNSGTTEGTNLYTFNGSAAKTVNIIAGNGITLTAASGSVTVSGTTITIRDWTVS